MTVDERVREIARVVVSRVAPEELVFFDAASEAYFRDRGRREARTGRDPLGFGVTEVVTLVTPVALAVSAAVADELLGRTASAVVDRGARGLRWLRGKAGRAERDDAPAQLPPAREFDQRDLKRIRDLARQKAQALGLPDEQVELFVDALIGSLAAPDDGGV